MKLWAGDEPWGHDRDARI